MPLSVGPKDCCKSLLSSPSHFVKCQNLKTQKNMKQQEKVLVFTTQFFSWLQGVKTSQMDL